MVRTTHSEEGAVTPKLDKQFTAKLQKSPEPGGWTYVVMGRFC
jgi:hypothetical protein